MAGDDVNEEARRKAEEVVEAIRTNPHWRTKHDRPFDAHVTADGIEISPLEDQEAGKIKIRLDQLVDSFSRVLRLERARETPRIGDFTPGFFHSYAAAFYYGWIREPGTSRGPRPVPIKVSPSQVPPPATSRGAPRSRGPVTAREALERAMARLSSARPVFHNEADFQHALAQALVRYGFEDPRLELRLPFEVAANLDVYAVWFGQSIGMELKYKTRELAWNSPEGELFRLRNQSAVDVARFDVLSDIQRLEYAIGKEFIEVGFAIFLTNDSGYWKERAGQGRADESFRFHQGQRVTGELRWGATASQGTRAGRDRPIILAGTYGCDWRDYSKVSDERAGVFRFLALEVTAPGTVPPRSEAPDGDEVDRPG